MVGEALASVGILPNDVVLGYGVSAIKKMARAMAALNVAKVVVKGTEPEARLLYRLLTMLERTSSITD